MVSTTLSFTKIKDDGVPLTPALFPSSTSAWILTLNFPLARQVLKDVTLSPMYWAIFGSSATSRPLLDGVTSKSLSVYFQKASFPPCPHAHSVASASLKALVCLGIG